MAVTVVSKESLVPVLALEYLHLADATVLLAGRTVPSLIRPPTVISFHRSRTVP